MINCVGKRLREVDPLRWEGVPITYKTNFLTDEGRIDLRVCIHVIDAMEREFCIDIDERKTLLTSIEDCFGFVMDNHHAV